MYSYDEIRAEIDRLQGLLDDPQTGAYEARAKGKPKYVFTDMTTVRRPGTIVGVANCFETRQGSIVANLGHDAYLVEIAGESFVVHEPHLAWEPDIGTQGADATD